jgi:hypothetical protein
MTNIGSATPRSFKGIGSSTMHSTSAPDCQQISTCTMVLEGALLSELIRDGLPSLTALRPTALCESSRTSKPQRLTLSSDLLCLLFPTARGSSIAPRLSSTEPLWVLVKSCQLNHTRTSAQEPSSLFPLFDPGMLSSGTATWRTWLRASTREPQTPASSTSLLHRCAKSTQATYDGSERTFSTVNHRRISQEVWASRSMLGAGPSMT